MKRSILSVLVVASGIFRMMAQAPAPAKGPAPKSQAEAQALGELQKAQGNPDAMIKACDDLLTKFADTEFKELCLYMQAISYEQKGDMDKATIFGERVLEINPKNFQVTLMLGQMMAQRTRENDLDKEEKLTKADKMLTGTIESLKAAPKPNPQITDQQWDEGKKQMTAEAHNGLGLVALTRKKYDVAIKEFQTAIDNDPQPAYSVRLASALQTSGKNAEAVVIVDKLMADPQLHPQIKQVAQQVKNAATAATKK